MKFQHSRLLALPPHGKYPSDAHAAKQVTFLLSYLMNRVQTWE